MKKTLVLFATILGLFGLGSYAFAQMGGGIGPAQYLKLVGTAISPLNSSWTLGSVGNRIAAGYFTTLDATTMAIGGAVSGALHIAGLVTGDSGFTGPTFVATSTSADSTFNRLTWGSATGSKLVVASPTATTPLTVTGGTIGGQFTSAGGASVTLADGSAGLYGLKTAYDVQANSILVSSGGGLSTLSGNVVLSPAGTPQFTILSGGGATSAGTVTSTFAGPVSTTKMSVSSINFGSSGSPNSGMTATGANTTLQLLAGGFTALDSHGSYNYMTTLYPAAHNTYGLGAAGLAWSGLELAGPLNNVGAATSTFFGPVSSTRLFVDRGGTFESNGTSTMGPYLFVTDSGAVTAMDMDVTSAAANEQQMSYDFNIDGNPFLQMFSLADAAGSIKATSTGVRVLQPWQSFSSQKVQRNEVDASAYTIVYPGDFYIAASSTSLAAVITLPSATSVLSGTEFVVKDRKGNAGVNNITVTSTVGVTIDGASSKVINSAYGTFHFISDGVSNWEIN